MAFDGETLMAAVGAGDPAFVTVELRDATDWTPIAGRIGPGLSAAGLDPVVGGGVAALRDQPVRRGLPALERDRSTARVHRPARERRRPRADGPRRRAVCPGPGRAGRDPGRAGAAGVLPRPAVGPARPGDPRERPDHDGAGARDRIRGLRDDERARRRRAARRLVPARRRRRLDRRRRPARRPRASWPRSTRTAGRRAPGSSTARRRPTAARPRRRASRGATSRCR